MHSGLDQNTVAFLPDREKVIALVGSPNCGKTTLFNWLTGSRFKTVNYPGSTVDYLVGGVHERYGKWTEPLWVMDTPGTYSLEPKSPDEHVTIQAIYEHERFGHATLVVSVADATMLSRQLFITRQLIAAGFHTVLAITMNDLLERRGLRINIDVLAEELGVPVMLVDGRLGGGMQALVDVVRSQLSLRWHKPGVESHQSAIGKPVPGPAWSAELIEQTMREIDGLVNRAVQPLTKDQKVGESESAVLKGQPLTRSLDAREKTRRLDRVLLHPFWGLAFFLFLMTSLFSGIFWFAQPMMDLIDQFFSVLAERILAQAPDHLLNQFLSQGVIASVSSVLVFVPQIFILFTGIILLEDSGYLARSAALVDRPLHALGMGGRSFVPLLSGFACAVPAMLAARTISSRRERLITLAVIPLMSCSARLPVFALLLSFLFQGDQAWKAGIALALIYLTSLILGGFASLVVGRILKTDERSFFMLELPVYRRPKPWLILRQALSRTKAYVLRAGPMIFTFALIVWLATTFPRYDIQNRTERLQASYAADVGRTIEPVFRPMGLDWRVGVGLMSAFAAREVFVSSVAVMFQVVDEDQDSLQENLLARMREAKGPDGLPLFTFASVMGLVVFFMIALQCLSTVSVSIRESGGLKFAMVQLVALNAIGYLLAVGVYQTLHFFQL